MGKMTRRRVRLPVGGEVKVWSLSEAQFDLLGYPEWTQEEAIDREGSRAVQMLNGLVATGLMRRVGLKWKRTALGGRVLNRGRGD